MSGKIIIVNRFAFCFDHGNELCHLCDEDFRFDNNNSAGIARALARKLGNEFEAENGFDLQERQPINIYTYGVKPHTHHRGPQASGSCTEHSKLDCQKCYDWIRLISAEATGDGIDAVRARVIRSG
ncbi:hypothetical protein HGRIS_006580 [Hohenbuehelia grisea]|uniref:Uncharacterized protein n=1 Tax=Hohenbuehelia grisea TaxID=104357 RepID=A0ABR3J9X5_9AGAR